MRMFYQHVNFRPASLVVINQANDICGEYAAQGYDLTLRQLYYQFVARDLIPNRQTEYKRLGSIISDARLAGMLDWDYIVDRTRNLRQNAHWDSPGDALDMAAHRFAYDKWAAQGMRVEVWVEKDALIGVVERVCRPLDVPFFACRGYVSQSEMWGAAQRHLDHFKDQGQETLVLHLGDHDPSGLDMTRDMRDRLETFGAPTTMRRIALNMDQIEIHHPPPNPAKLTDSRGLTYVQEYGYDSWELDALPPDVLGRLIIDHVLGVRDEGVWATERRREESAKVALAWLAEQDIEGLMRKEPG